MKNLSEPITDFQVIFRNIHVRSVVSKPVFTWVYHGTRILLSLIFIVSGISKLIDPASFSVTIEAYGLMPDLLTFPAALAISFTEVIAGIGLLFDVHGSLASILIMLLFFITILLYGMHLGLDIDCGCFGPGDPESDAFHHLSSAFTRDLMMVFIIMYMYLFRFLKPYPPVTVRNLYTKINIKRSVKK